MPFEPHSLQSRLADMCRELGCPPGRDMVEWLRGEVSQLRDQVRELQDEIEKRRNELQI
jgi:polyhydroxyalkanoate synthesis regulator phasin